ncbi:hypothetical protein [Methylovulum psychrotolerans]|uniref:YceK/YidQ family lipoprotein n=1 Tax=Methylovulum psychrotolerans TaxID=1704499 RepID=A0A2S5CL78_9GAMM|nr:hypothetical protein [Methylovulum psychrotolerans]MBT9096500.1 hypothetical protein [Methylovulum psychrotolerans]POZ51548.1 hypothetical protein AADEFJLK_02414 [Methylovulum psychrotolerans]
MNKTLRLFFKGQLALCGACLLSACYPLTVNLNVATDKPIALYWIVDKPIAVKLDADVAVTKLPAIQADGNIGITKLPPIKLAH